jgi:hypothetical protein
MSKLHLITVATHSERYFPVLNQQTKDKDIELVKLAYGQKYTGHYMKDLETIKYLNKPEVKDDDIVVFVDGFDTLLLSDKNEIINKFKEFNCKLLLSIENVGGLSFIHSAVFQKVKGKFINTGLYMGYAGYMKKFLEEMYSSDYDDNSNQKTWANFLEKKNNYNNIALDVDSEIFLNYSFTSTNKIKIKDGRVIVSERGDNINNKLPCFIQGNGCEDLSKIIKSTGYSKYDVHKDNRTFKVIENNLKAVFLIYPIVALYITLLIFIFVVIALFFHKIYTLYNDKYYYIYL